jgi:uncharacterized protein
VIRGALLAAIAAAVAASPAPAPAAQSDHRFSVPVLPGGGFNLSMKTMLDRRFHAVIRQRYDFSCGSAALATLLRFHYGVRADETSVFDGMWSEGDRAQIRARGFSLLDMKRYLGALGLSAEGYRVKLDQVATTGVPGIALTVTNGYRHFVVVKGVTATEVLVGDPSRGLIAYRRDQFLRTWDGLFFVITTSPAVGKGSFNRASQWASVGRAPVGGTFGRPVEVDALRLAAPVLGEF